MLRWKKLLLQRWQFHDDRQHWPFGNWTFPFDKKVHWSCKVRSKRLTETNPNILSTWIRFGIYADMQFFYSFSSVRFGSKMMLKISSFICKTLCVLVNFQLPTVDCWYHVVVVVALKCHLFLHFQYIEEKNSFLFLFNVSGHSASILFMCCNLSLRSVSISFCFCSLFFPSLK